MFDDLEARREALAARQRAMSEQMKQDGSHLLSGHPYTPSTQGSRILAKYIAIQQQQTLASIYRMGKP